MKGQAGDLAFCKGSEVLKDRETCHNFNFKSTPFCDCRFKMVQVPVPPGPAGYGGRAKL